MARCHDAVFRSCSERMPQPLAPRILDASEMSARFHRARDSLLSRRFSVPFCTAEREFVPFMPIENIVESASSIFSIHGGGSIPTNYIVALEHVRSQELRFLGLDVARRLSRQPKKAAEFSSGLTSAIRTYLIHWMDMGAANLVKS